MPFAAPPPADATAFAELVNAHLRQLQRQHDAQLPRGADLALRHARHAALTLRRAAALHAALLQIEALPSASESDDYAVARRHYLRGVRARLQAAAVAPDVRALRVLLDAAAGVLDGFMQHGAGVFEPVAVDKRPDAPLLALARARRLRRADAGAAPSPSPLHDEHMPPPPPPPLLDDDMPPPPFARAHDDMEQRALAYRPSIFGWSHGESRPSTAPSRRRRCFGGLSCADLSTRDRMVLWLYVLMVLGAVSAVAAVTVQFIQQAVAPGSFIRSTTSEQLMSPVVTVCLSQRGVPFSRLQLFDFVDAQQRVFKGTMPEMRFGEQEDIEAFKRVVERFWDNPDGEDCDAKVGDHLPFPVVSLNELASGSSSTRCRACYRVGSKHEAVVTDTSFEKSSVLHMFTDSYFLQCMKSECGLDARSLRFVHEQIVLNAAEMQQLGMLSVANGGNVWQLSMRDIGRISGPQACNVFYFAYLPMKQRRADDGVDVRYEFNGSRWRAVGDGPYFEPRGSSDFLPEESLQMFVSTNATTRARRLGSQHDVILLRPNTQTFATFRPLVVYDVDRYDISSSTSALRSAQVVVRFGFWLRYKILYNYNRFVVHEYYRECTYPAGQCIVDLTGYGTCARRATATRAATATPLAWRTTTRSAWRAAAPCCCAVLNGRKRARGRDGVKARAAAGGGCFVYWRRARRGRGGEGGALFC